MYYGDDMKMEQRDSEQNNIFDFRILASSVRHFFGDFQIGQIRKFGVCGRFYDIFDSENDRMKSITRVDNAPSYVDPYPDKSKPSCMNPAMYNIVGQISHTLPCKEFDSIFLKEKDVAYLSIDCGVFSFRYKDSYYEDAENGSFIEDTIILSIDDDQFILDNQFEKFPLIYTWEIVNIFVASEKNDVSCSKPLTYTNKYDNIIYTYKSIEKTDARHDCGGYALYILRCRIPPESWEKKWPNDWQRMEKRCLKQSFNIKRKKYKPIEIHEQFRRDDI